MSANSSIAVLTSPVGRKRIGWWVAPIAVAAALAIAALALRPWGDGARPLGDGTFYAVAPVDLNITVSKDGELHAIDYTDIKSQVEGLTQIIEIVKEGATVKKGDRLIVLDSSLIQIRKEETDQALRKAEAALKIAVEMKEIQESQNAANLEAAQVQLRLAELDLKQYEDGLYPQQHQNAKTALEMANLSLKNKEEDLAKTRRLFDKGFVTAADVKKAELDVTTASNDVAKAETALKVLEKYAHAMEIARLNSAQAQAEQRYARVLRENRSLLTQRLADVAEKEALLKDLQERQAKLERQLEACTIYAPEDGLVLYASSVDRGRDQIREGTPVRERHWLLRLPDVSRMKAVLRIQESLVPRLDVEKQQRAIVRIVGVPRPIGAVLTRVSVLADNASRWWNPDLKEYPVELTLDETPPGLKPGTGVHVEILVDRYENVLAVPLVALYSAGTESYVFVREASSVTPRKVAIGASNETHIQILEGLTDGEEVLLLQPGQGRALLEQAGIKIPDPATRPAQTAARPAAKPATGATASVGVN